MEPLFSIIIPVYNTEKYIAQCLDSIINQNYTNFEIICIDNGSVDNSQKILQDYAQKDNRIKLLAQNNLGAGSARNFGIQNTNGDYICFIDSDDYIKPDTLKQCADKLNDETELIIFGAKTLKNSEKAGQYSSKNFPAQKNSANIFKYHTVCWNKVYKKDFLIKNNIEFTDAKTGEDQLFFLKSMLLSEKTEIIKKDFYVYRKGRNGALTACKTKKDLSPIQNFYEIEKFITKTKLEKSLKQKILSKYLLKCISWYSKTDETLKETYATELIKLLTYIKSQKLQYWWKYFEFKPQSNLKFEYLKSKIRWTIKG